MDAKRGLFGGGRARSNGLVALASTFREDYHTTMRIIYSTRNVEIPAGGVHDTAVWFYSVVADCVVYEVDRCACKFVDAVSTGFVNTVG
jgi:hypothetical protein